ncbi:SLBB domain-containing protein [Gammaproteobacteria bacterium]|nr:SLBB domain-containing protein [Gammaproteobacteria bacterium]
MKILNIVRSSSILFLLLISPFISAQTFDIKSLKQALDKNGAAGDMASENQSYESFTQNSLASTVQQLGEVDEALGKDLYLQELQAARLELASKLCAQDPKACFLIDHYRNLKELEAPKTEKELKLFGVEIFRGYPLPMESSIDSLVPETYSLQPGDAIKLEIFGPSAATYEENITYDGQLIVPSIGAFQVAGTTLLESRLKIQQFLKDRYPGSQFVLSVAQAQPKQINVMGNVNNPGQYNLSFFADTVNAIVAAGGFQSNSSLRNIRIMRGGVTVATDDIYDLLIEGKSSVYGDLRQGDTILVGAIESSASILGETNRAAIYEIKDGDTLNTLLRFGLGLSTQADSSNIAIQRILENGKSTVLNYSSLDKVLLQNGDIVTIGALSSNETSGIEVIGASRKAGMFAYKSGMVFADLLKPEIDLLPSTYMPYAVIKRFNPRLKSYSFLDFDLLSEPALKLLSLKPGDKIFIFSTKDIAVINSYGLYESLQPISPQDFITESLTQREITMLSAANSGSSEPEPTSRQIDPSDIACFAKMHSYGGASFKKLLKSKLEIFSQKEIMSCTDTLNEYPELLPRALLLSSAVSGNISKPGLYPISSQVQALDLISIAGIINEKKNMFEVSQGGEVQLFSALEELRAISNIHFINVRETQSNNNIKYVELIGEFKLPGIYPLASNDTYLDVVKRAQGLTGSAFPMGAIVTRNSIQEMESEALKRAERELSEIMVNALANGYIKQGGAEFLSVLDVVTKLNRVDPVGRLVADLNVTKIQKNPSLDIMLEDGDTIYMPKIATTITIVGNVLNPVTVPYRPAMNFNDYIKQAGGLKDLADSSRIYAILPNGQTVLSRNGYFLRQDSLLPGSTIIVPRKARPLNSLSLVEVLTPILANLSVTAAAISSISKD